MQMLLKLFLLKRVSIYKNNKIKEEGIDTTSYIPAIYQLILIPHYKTFQETLNRLTKFIMVQ